MDTVIAEGLKKNYNSFPALDGISLSMHRDCPYLRTERSGVLASLCGTGSKWGLSLALIILIFASYAHAEEYTFDISEIEKKPYHIGGYLEFKPALFGLDKKASLYKLKFYNRDEGSKIEEYNSTLQLEGSLEKGIAKLFVKTNIERENGRVKGLIASMFEEILKYAAAGALLKKHFDSSIDYARVYFLQR